MSTSGISPALAGVLQTGRSYFNARVAEYSRTQTGFDTGALQGYIAGPLDRLARLAAERDPARLNALVAAAFDAQLTLQARGKADLPVVLTIWNEVLPACLPVAMLRPRETIAALINAGLNLLATDNVRVAAWAQMLCRLGGRCSDLDTLRMLGQVLAWRCGAAHFRASALDVLDRLPSGLARDALAVGGDDDWPALLGRMRQDPWFDPAQGAATGLRVTHTVGGFAGFGGPFSCPPEVRVYGDGFVVRCRERHWYLSADVFGAVLHAGSAEEFAAGIVASGALVWRDNTLNLGDQSCVLDLPVEGRQIACAPRTAAVTSRFSHTIRLFALS
jgi:hypothetical protein